MKYILDNEEINIVDFDNYVPIEFGKDFIVVREKTVNELNEIKLNELTNWFRTDYATYEQMLVRRKTLGIDDTIVDKFRNKTYHNLIELYEEAEIVAGEIRELRK